MKKNQYIKPKITVVQLDPNQAIIQTGKTGRIYFYSQSVTTGCLYTYLTGGPGTYPIAVKGNNTGDEGRPNWTNNAQHS